MISFEDKSKTIALAGTFDPQRLACKIRCRRGKTVKDVQIVDVPGGNGNGKPPKKHKEKPPAAEPAQPHPQPSPPPEPAPQEMPRWRYHGGEPVR